MPLCTEGFEVRSAVHWTSIAAAAACTCTLRIAGLILTVVGIAVAALAFVIIIAAIIVIIIIIDFIVAWVLYVFRHNGGSFEFLFFWRSRLVPAVASASCCFPVICPMSLGVFGWKEMKCIQTDTIMIT